MRIWGRGGARPAAPAAAPGEGAGGGSPVWSPGRRPPAGPPAREPLRSPRNLSGLRVWQRCLEKGSAEAALLLLPLRVPHLPPAPSPSPPSARAPRRPPSRTGRAVARPPEQTWKSLPAPPGRNLGPWGREAASPSRARSPGAARASGSPGAGRARSVLRGARREPAAVPGAKIAAWPEAAAALGSCLQLGTRAGPGAGDWSPVAFLETADNSHLELP